MTRTYWYQMFVLGAATALLSAGCTIESGDGSGVGGSGGDGATGGTSGSGGSMGGTGGDGATGGTGGSVGGTGGSMGGTGGSMGGTGGSTGGSGGSTGGTGGGEQLLCEFDGEQHTAASCDISESDDCCLKCLRTNCCEEFGECFASPHNVCGGPEDWDETNSEYLCIRQCMTDFGPLPGEQDELNDCVAQCASDVTGELCGLGTISAEGNLLATCMWGGNGEENSECFEECFFEHDDSYVCSYD